MHYKYLFLSMSCNQPFFQRGAEVVKDTWARDLVNGIYPECTWFSYTAAEEYNYVDFDNNIVYVDTEDDIAHTLGKTTRCLQLLSERGITWDYVIRTNTSTYVNVDKVIEYLENYSGDREHTIHSTGMIHLQRQDGYRMDCPSGWFMILPNSLTNILITNNVDENSPLVDEIRLNPANTIRMQDDIAIGVVGIKFDYVLEEIPIKHYKTRVPHNYFYENEQPPEENIFNKPDQNIEVSEIKDHLCCVVRTYGAMNLDHRIREYEHMYELHQALKNIRHVRFLFLAMSCNKPFFKLSEKVVADTWAKDIINNKYPDCIYFSYTSTDENHREGIYGNTIYVDESDELDYTFEKTQKVIRMLRNMGYTWDYIVRTNTSTYINVPFLIDYVDYINSTQPNPSYLIAPSVGKVLLNDGTMVSIPHGFLMVIPSEVATYITMQKYNHNFEIVNQLIQMSDNLYGSTDDICIMAVIIDLMQRAIPIEIRVIDNIPYCDYKVQSPNRCLYDDIPEGTTQPINPIEDPEEAANYAATIVRYYGVPWIYRGAELEHMYEIHDALHREILL